MNLRDRFLENIRQLQGISATQMREQPIWKMVHAAEQFRLKDSTIRMLEEKFESFDETLEELRVLDWPEIPRPGYAFREGYLPVEGAWIQFDAPAWQIAAMFLSPPNERAQQQLLFAVDRQGQAQLLGISPDLGLRYLPVAHGCPECRWDGEECQPCAECAERLAAWGRVFFLSAVLIGQCLAEKRYEVETETSLSRQPREKSHKKARRRPTTTTFKVIDASEIIVRLPAAETVPPPPPPASPRGSWIDSSTQYKNIRTRPFVRHYRAARYTHMRGQTREFPHGIEREQPYKPERAAHTVTLVKAARYEDGDGDKETAERDQKSALPAEGGG